MTEAGEAGEVVQEFTGHDEYITAVAFTPQRNRFVSASRDRAVKLWDATTGK